PHRRPPRVPRDPQMPGDRLDRHPLRPVKPADLSPVLHCEHPLSPRLTPPSRKSPRRVTLQPPSQGQNCPVDDIYQSGSPPEGLFSPCPARPPLKGGSAVGRYTY